MRRLRRFLTVALLLALAAAGCDNVQSPRGEVTYLYKKAKWYRGASFQATQLGPTSTGWVWQMTGKFELTGLPKGSYTLRFLRGQDIKAEFSSVATGTKDLKVTIPD